MTRSECDTKSACLFGIISIMIGIIGITIGIKYSMYDTIHMKFYLCSSQVNSHTAP